MRLTTLTDALHHELQNLYSAEAQLLRTLPTLARGASARELAAGFEGRVAQALVHLARLESIGAWLGATWAGYLCKGVQGALDEARGLLAVNEPCEVLDLALIAVAQRVGHHEIAAYGSACRYAHQLGNEDVEHVLQATLDEVVEADRGLTRIADALVERMAVPA